MVAIIPVKQTYCVIDSKPINRSRAFQMACRLLSKKVAYKLLTYEDY